MSRRAFTLIELLVVIGIIAILAIVVILVLNPAELLRQARDANRLTDINNIERAIQICSLSTGAIGNASTTYFSLVDPGATTTSGSDCSSLGLTPPLGWNYHCAASSTYRSTDGTGWLPINFRSLASPPLFTILPIDPVNSSATGLYYSYTPSSAGICGALSTALESSKYEKQYGVNDGGLEPSRYERGSIPLIQSQEGLEAWWNFDEGSGSVVGDGTYDNDYGTFFGSGAHWSSQAKLGSYAAIFNGIDDQICIDLCAGNGRTITWQGAWTLTAWVKTTAAVGPIMSTIDYGGSVLLGISGGKIYLKQTECSPNQVSGNTTVNDGKYHFIVFVRRSTGGQIYVDGTSDAFLSQSSCASQTTSGLEMGHDPTIGFFQGSLDDARIYTRPLISGEVSALYRSLSL